MNPDTSTISTILPFRINISPIRLEAIQQCVRDFVDKERSACCGPSWIEVDVRHDVDRSAG